MPEVCVRAVLFFSFPNCQFHGVAAACPLSNVALKHGDCKDSCDMRGLSSDRPVCGYVSGRGAEGGDDTAGPLLAEVLPLVSVTKAMRPPLKQGGPPLT